MITVLNKKKDKCDYDTFYIGRGSAKNYLPNLQKY